MSKLLIVYSTTDGHTRAICERIARVIAGTGSQVTLEPVDRCLNQELELFDVIVVGASVRYGRHRPAVYRFVRRNTAVLNSRPSAFFSVNLTARKPEKQTPETNPYVRKFLKQMPWCPAEVAVFAGRLDYASYGCVDRSMIRLIMRITGGPIDPKAVIEFTDWKRVENFGQLVASL